MRREPSVGMGTTVLAITLPLAIGFPVWLDALPGPAGRAGRDAPVSVAIELEIRYPARNQRVLPDSNFLFGSVGSGAARLEIDGHPVPVEANGAFLAWLPVPAATRGDTALYTILVTEGADTVTTRFPVLRPPAAPPAGAPSPWVRTERLRRPVQRWYRPGDEFRLVLTGEAGAEVHLEAGDTRFSLPDIGPDRGTLRRYGGSIDTGALHLAACRAGDCRAGRSELPGADGIALTVRLDTVAATVVARAGSRETRWPVTFHLVPYPDPAPRARLREADDPVNGQSDVVVGRPTSFGPYRWRFPTGTVASVAARVGERVALRLGGGQVAWVSAEDIVWEAVETEDGAARALDGRVAAVPGAVDFRLGLTRPAPARATVTGPRSIRLTIYDTYGEMSRLSHGVGTGVARVDWSQSPGPQLHIDLTFEWPIWGYELFVERGDAGEYEGPAASASVGDGGGDGAVLRLAVRRPPEIDASAPLRGRRIAVDAGHPGAGSYGPTGLYEGDANLAITQRLIEMLEAAGAEPVAIRSDRGAVGLYDRTRLAREAGAELFVSIHNNALPDGVRPFERAGTSTFYYHPHSAALARRVQEGMVQHMGLRDRGVVWGDLAVVREPWLPAVLTEGAFMMIPAHEAALRTPAFQDRYARGVLAGIEAFLRDFAERP
ncbi:MAG: N-acetylmuramoyl-L-alanine amidase [Gemmatimonadota bacterium]